MSAAQARLFANRWLSTRMMIPKNPPPDGCHRKRPLRGLLSIGPVHWPRPGAPRQVVVLTTPEPSRKFAPPPVPRSPRQTEQRAGPVPVGVVEAEPLLDQHVPP